MLTGELWLVAGEDTGEDSLLMEDAAGEGEKYDETTEAEYHQHFFIVLLHHCMEDRCTALTPLVAVLQLTPVYKHAGGPHGQKGFLNTAIP